MSYMLKIIVSSKCLIRVSFVLTQIRNNPSIEDCARTSPSQYTSTSTAATISNASNSQSIIVDNSHWRRQSYPIMFHIKTFMLRYIKLFSVPIWFVDSYHIPYCIVVLQSNLLQASLIQFVIYFHVPYQKLHVAIHSVPFSFFLSYSFNCLLSYFIVYFHVAIHSVLSRPDRIHHIPSRSILKPSHFNPFSYFPFQYDQSTPITFHSILSGWNTFHSKPSQ